MLLSLKVTVGGLLTLNFFVPLWILGRNARLREEPMVLLVINLVLIGFAFALAFFITGMADVVFPGGVPPPVCATLHYIMCGLVIAWKMAMLFLAVDQFVAVVHCLRYNFILNTLANRLVAITWCCVPLFCLLGLICYQLDLESSAEFDRRVYGIQHDIQECRWELHSHAYILAFEVVLLVLSIISAGLFVYTATQGMLQERRLAQRRQEDQGDLFLLRFKSFRRIVKILLLVATIDIIGKTLRISSRGSPQLEVKIINMLRIPFMAGEAWVYGLSNVTIRKAIRDFFVGCRCVNPTADERNPAGQPSSERPLGTADERNPADQPPSERPPGTADERNPAGQPSSERPLGTANERNPADQPPSERPPGTANEGNPAGQPPSERAPGTVGKRNPAGQPPSERLPGTANEGNPAGQPPSERLPGTANEGNPADLPPSERPPGTVYMMNPADHSSSERLPGTASERNPAGQPPSERPPGTSDERNPAGQPPSERPPGTVDMRNPADHPSSERLPGTANERNPADQPSSERPPETVDMRNPADHPSSERLPGTANERNPAGQPSSERPPGTVDMRNPAGQPPSERPPGTVDMRNPADHPSSERLPGTANERNPGGQPSSERPPGTADKRNPAGQPSSERYPGTATVRTLPALGEHFGCRDSWTLVVEDWDSDLSSERPVEMPEPEC